MSVRTSMKTLLLGIVLILIIGVGGLVWRNAVEHPNEPIACPVDAKVCPDGTAVAREGTACEFPACPPPNDAIGAPFNIAYAVPQGFSPFMTAGGATSTQYVREYASTSSTSAAYIAINRYPIAASSTALATIQATAIGGTSGVPVPLTAYSSTSVGGHQFTVVSIERFAGVVDTAYYLAREGAGDVLRFDAIDNGVTNWNDPALDASTLPAAQALRQMLATFQGQ